MWGHCHCFETWVSKPWWIHHLCALSPACNGFLRFTSGATPAHLLAISMAAKLFSSTQLRTSIGGGLRRDQDLSCCCCLTVWNQADALPTFIHLSQVLWVQSHLLTEHLPCSTFTIAWTIVTIHKRSLGQGNIFTPVYHSVHGGGGGRGGCPGRNPPGRLLLRAVGILLECISC